MTLTFTQSSDQSFGGVPAYEAEFEVTGNFAIHIERTRGDAALILKQRTGGGKYALVDDFNYAKSKGEVLDYEASVSIPKFIKIVSEVEPTLAEIVTDGEVTEIKAQSKVVEITNNGTMEVIPDSGFAYLSKVNIKTNVPQNGGGSGEGEGGGSTGGSGVEYFVYDGSNMAAIMLSLLSMYTKVSASRNGGTPYIMVGPTFAIKATSPSGITMTEIAFGVDLNARVNEERSPETLSTIKEYVLSNGVTEEEIAALPRITEEEFYNLNA